MNAARKLRELGQSLWLDNITRALLRNGVLSRYISDFAVTGLTSNPTIFDHAIRGGGFYDDAIRNQPQAGRSAEDLFLELALEDIVEAAGLFRTVHEASGGTDGWVSLEVSPLLANDSAGTVRAAAELHRRAACPNLLIKIPGTPAGLVAVEETIFAGVPVNVTLLFSPEQYVAAAEAYMRGIERRVNAGLDPKVGSVASVFISRWDVAVKDRVPQGLRNRLGIAIAMRVYQSYRSVLASPRWRSLAARGAAAQRLLWASTGTKDPAASDILYVEALAAPDTINTVPDGTLVAYADHGRVRATLDFDVRGADDMIAEFNRAGIDEAALAADLQREGTASFAKSWEDLMLCIASRAPGLQGPADGRGSAP